MSIPEFIPNYYAFDMVVNDRSLTIEEREYLIDCINKIYRANYKVVYRGDKKHILQNLYGADTAFNQGLTESLFIIGAKGNMFSAVKSTATHEINIGNAGTNVFATIFRMLANLFSKEYESRAITNAISKFRSTEEEVSSYFLDENNFKKFLAITAVLNDQEKMSLRDYYLGLLHHISKSDYYSQSFLLSTTASFRVAHRFAWLGENSTSTNPVILFGWVPKKYEGLLSVPDHRGLNINLRNSGLPLYERNFFPRQNEITLKGGLLPHYLIGFLHYRNGRQIFQVNPALLETDQNWDGVELPIDQSTFQERIALTEYAIHFSVDNEGNYSQERVRR